jgi:hypothetical protein
MEIRVIREEFRTHFAKCDELVKRLGNAIKKAGIVKLSDICHEIKNILAEEITDKKITVRTIDRCCPDEWKRITKPKKDILSFSPPKPLQQITVEEGGKSQMLDEKVPIPTPQPDNVSAQTASYRIKADPHSDSKSEQDIQYSDTDLTSVSTPIEQEPAISQVHPDQVLQETSHEIRILLSRDSLSEQIAQVDSPGIEWVQLSGVLDEKSGIVSNLKLTNGRAEGGV